MSISSWPPLSLTCDEGLLLIVMVVVTGLDAVDALVGNCDNVDTIANGLVFDCGTGFCTTGVAVNSRLSFTDITCNTTQLQACTEKTYYCLTRLVKSSPLITASCEISVFLFTMSCCSLPTCTSAISLVTIVTKLCQHHTYHIASENFFTNKAYSSVEGNISYT